MTATGNGQRALVALGANLTSKRGAPWQTMIWALQELAACSGTHLRRISSLWRCSPFGVMRQPVFFNAVAELETELSPHELLAVLVMLEHRAGRRRGRTWTARTLDLDLLAHGGRVIRPIGMGRKGSPRARHAWQGRGLVLPHPGLHERVFVLAPVVEVAADWRHPLLGATASQLLARLPWRERAACRKMAEMEITASWRNHSRRLLVELNGG